MKKLVLLLIAISIGLVGALIVRSQRSNAQVEIAQKETTTISNQLSEVQIKLNHNERLNATFKSQLAERDAGVAGLSNNVADLRAKLAVSRAETEAARAEAGSMAERARAVAAERDGFSNRVSELEVAVRTGTDRAHAADERALKSQSDLAAMSQQLAAVQLEKQHLDELFADPDALRAQIEAVRRSQAAAQAPAPRGKPDYRFAARLESDGSVTLAPPPLKKSSANSDSEKLVQP